MSKYYIYSNPFMAGTVARAEDVNDKYIEVQSAFDYVEADFDLCALVAGNVYSGEHDFLSAEVLVAAPTEDNHVVNKIYADTLAFEAGEFPNKTGNEYKIITTDGDTVFWTELDGGVF